MSLPFVLAVHGERLAIARLDPTATVPPWARGTFVNISRTRNELSIVCAQEPVPSSVQHERDKIAFGIVGVVPMTTIGLLASLCGALAAAKVPVFAISTYDTDYLLISAVHFDAAATALTTAGYQCQGALPC
ncbi:MAG: ACT domain-containing protein [Planctomycetota bacterium]